MRKQRWFTLILVVLGLMLIVVAGASVAQDDEEEPEYYGLRDCRDCHRDVANIHQETLHAQALIDVTDEDDKALILGDLTQDSDALLITFPGEDEARKLTAADIAYTVGAGRYVQRYLAETDDGLQVLPVTWDVGTSSWAMYPLGETWPDPAFDFVTQCAACHVTGLNLEDREWVDDGVQCETCHGPGSIHVEAADDAGGSIDEEEYAAIVNSIVLSADDQICGQCHNQGVDADGIHPFPTTYYAGKDLTENYTLFTTAESSLWWTETHASGNNMQYNEWLLSAHSNTPAETLANIDGASEECLACHSGDYRLVAERIATWDPEEHEDGPPPAAITLETAAHGVTCVSCHNPHLEEDAANDFLLRTDDLYSMCTDCHSDNDPTDGLHHPVQQLYEGVTVIEAVVGTPSGHFAAEDGPDCVTCHMPAVPVETFALSSHSFAPIAPGDALDLEALQDSCTQCHAEQADPVAMQALIDDIQASTVARVAAARAAVTDENPEWVSLALDMVAGDGSDGIHNYGYVDDLLDAVEAALNINVGGAE